MTAADTTACHDVLIVGGGNAGLGAAARLRRRGHTDVAVIEPQQVHTYRPLLSYVGGGEATLSSAERTQRWATPGGCAWIRDTAVHVDPDARVVRCASGRRYGYRDLILGPGLVPDDDALPGIAEAVDSAAVASNYLDRAEQTWELVKALPVGGHAVFTVPRPPVGCSATTVKPVFLAVAHWKRTGRWPGARITVVIDRPRLLGVPPLDEQLDRHFAQVGATVHWNTRVSALAPRDRTITVVDAAGTVTTLGYDMLHLVPPFKGAPIVAASGLDGGQPAGLIDIDPTTLRHRRHPAIWAAGDGAAVATDSSGGALRHQTQILVDNLRAARDGGSEQHYDGYTVAPIAVDAHRLVLGEYDGRGELASSLPSAMDPLKPRRWAWAVDRYLLPAAYWRLLLAGRL